MASCVSTNETAGFLEHQYFGKESIDILVFLPGDIHQGKVTYETTTFAGCGQVSVLSNQIAVFFDQQ